MDMLPWWAGNSSVLIAFFLVCIVAGFVLMRPMKGKKSAEWKVVDFAIVLVGTVGLFGLTFQARLTATQIQAPYSKVNEEYLRTWIPQLLRQIELVCEPHPRTSTSPPNNDDIEADRHQLCEWATSNFKNHARLIVQGQDELFVPNKWTPFPKLRTDIGSAIPFQGNGRWFVDAANQWDKDVETVREANERVPENGTYRALTFLGPFILAIAIAAQIVKIFYEKRD